MIIYLLLILNFGKVNGFLSARGAAQLLLSSTTKMMAKNIQQSSGPTPNPPRVVSGAGVSVRQQIAWAKAFKRFISMSSTSTQQGKKFRKEKSSKKDSLELDETIDIDFTTIKPPAVFVDGYNIIGFTNSLKGMDNLSSDLGEDRDRLLNDLCILRGVTGWAIEVIFDAYKAPPSPSASPFSSGMKSRSQTVDGVVVTFTSNSETADNYIERRFEELRKSGFTNMAVATDDLVLQALAGQSAMGLGYLSASMLLEEISIAYRGWDQLQEEMETEMKLRTVGGTIRIGDQSESEANDVLQAIETLKVNAAKEAAELKAKRQLEISENKNNFGDKITNNRKSNQENSTKRKKQKQTQGISDDSMAALKVAAKNKAINSDSSQLFMGNLRQPTLADGLSPELQRIMEKMKSSMNEDTK
eukprot:gene29049-38100_t